MTGEQTVKGLEICSSEHLGCEDGCPYVGVACLGGDALLKDALALVKTNNIEIDILIRKNETLKDENFELKAEVEKYENIKTTINEFWDILLRFKLAKRKEKPTLEEFADALEEIKNEAIKEFAERLKERHCGNTYPYVLLGDIDNLVKEMTEGRG